jgi:hypothetical protein
MGIGFFHVTVQQLDRPVDTDTARLVATVVFAGAPFPAGDADNHLGLPSCSTGSFEMTTPAPLTGHFTCKRAFVQYQIKHKLIKGQVIFCTGATIIVGMTARQQPGRLYR